MPPTRGCSWRPARCATPPTAARFLDGLTEEFDLPATILSGEEEAALSYAGAVSAVGASTDRVGHECPAAGSPPALAGGPPPERPAVAVIDIGGGSLELAVGAPPAPEPSFVCSLDIGVVRLTERFFASDPPAEGQWSAAEAFVRSTLAAAVPGAVRAAVGRGIGLAGTFTTLVAHKLALRTYDRALVHGHELTLADIDAALADLPAPAERGARPAARHPARPRRRDPGRRAAGPRGVPPVRPARRTGERGRPARRRRPAARPRLRPPRRDLHDPFAGALRASHV